MSAVWQFLKRYGLAGLWLIVAALICGSYFGDSGAPSHSEFASNTRGAFYALLVVSLVETTALYLLLRPWSYHRSFGRPLIALLLFAPWTMLNVMFSMRAQTIILLHSLWLLFIVCPLLITLFVVSAIAVVVDKKRARAGAESEA